MLLVLGALLESFPTLAVGIRTGCRVWLCGYEPFLSEAAEPSLWSTARSGPGYSKKVVEAAEPGGLQSVQGYGGLGLARSSH